MHDESLQEVQEKVKLSLESTVRNRAYGLFLLLYHRAAMLPPFAFMQCEAPHSCTAWCSTLNSGFP